MKSFSGNRLLFCTLLFLVCSCSEPSNIQKSDFDFLLGNWEMSNPAKRTEITMVWEDLGDELKATVVSKNDEYSWLNFTAYYSIYKKRGQWYWFSDHTDRTNLPSYHYKLRKMEKEEFFIAPKRGEITFLGRANENKGTRFQLHWKDEKLLIHYSIFANGYIFEKIE